MHIGNQLYSSLSQLSRQSFLLLTDLPSMLTVLEEDYQLEYSESYTGKELLSHPNEKLVKARWVELCINQIKRKIREGPYFICTVCNRILYKKSVITCINEKYPCQTYFNIQQSFDGKQCICNTCHSKVIKGNYHVRL